MTKAHEEAAEQTYRAIGRFIFQFSQAEYTLREILGNIIGIREDYFCVIIETINVGQLCNIAREVLARPEVHWNAKILTKLIGEFQNLNLHRNRVAHGLWVPFMDGGTVHHVPANKPRPTTSTDQAALLEQYADEACALRAALDRAFSELPEQGPL